jgi:2'-5' RNA ligase
MVKRMPSVRAFLAIPLPEPLQRRIATLQSELASTLPGIRWVRPATIHLTLRFFGETGADDLEKIRASMLSVKLGINPCQIDLQGLGAFPDRRRPRVVWIGLAPPEPLLSLQQRCEEALGRAGISREPRPFAPHLTIGRFRVRGPDLTALLAGQDGRRFGTMPLAQLVLYESRLRPDGARHIPLFTVPLQERDDLLNNRTPQEGSEHGRQRP